VAEGSSETIRMDKMYHTHLQGKDKKLKCAGAEPFALTPFIAT
jgi:hypothetical protein